MANTYTQLYAHIVFAVKGRANLIAPQRKDELCKYITGIITNKGQKLMVINGMPDHMHLLVGFRPDVSLSDLVRDIKSNSSRFINENKWVTRNFEWQRGFGAFTLGYSQIDLVAQYIRNQEEHHKTKTFSEEYVETLNQNEIDYKTEYLFE
jgi:REP element-mobilizing transposase RayT